MPNRNLIVYPPRCVCMFSIIPKNNTTTFFSSRPESLWLWQLQCLNYHFFFKIVEQIPVLEGSDEDVRLPSINRVLISIIIVWHRILKLLNILRFFLKICPILLPFISPIFSSLWFYL